MIKKPILCLDFDGVLHSYISGWKGAAVIPDPPVPGAMHFVASCLDHFTVNIFSSRSHQVGGRDAMKGWLREHLRDYLEATPGISPIQAAHAANKIVETALYFPAEKPAALVTIDDRAITFTGIWPGIEELLAFKPWNKKGESK